MKLGLVGYAGTGKSTVFRWLTGVTPDPAKVQQGQTGTTDLPDERLDYFSAKFKPKKTTYAKIVFLDTPGLMRDERKDNNRRLGILREASGLLVVLDGFSGSDPVTALRNFREEMLYADMDIVSNRVEKLKANLKKPRPAKERELEQAEFDLLSRMMSEFEKGNSPATLGLREEDEKLIRSFQLLTLKPEMVLLNAAEATQAVPAGLKALAPNLLVAAAKMELELEELSPEDREAFMSDLGMKELSRSSILRQVFYGMGQQVFFTVGEDECRAWPVVKGATAVEGAGEIHSDLAKRFVRAEVVGHDDFRRVGSMKDAKAAGVYRLEGKDYVIQDGDIMHIL